jgi:hypothetical protein
MYKIIGTFLIALAAMAGNCATTEHLVEAASAAAKAEHTGASASDCSAETNSLPPGTSRIYIALRNGKDGSGSSMADARDGSTVAAFDTILRCYSEGCTDHQNPRASVTKTENLIVCLGPGTFRTKGAYDFLILVPHNTQEGFTIGKGWKIHGQGIDKTTVQMSAYRRSTDPNDQRLYPLDTGGNTVFSTNSDNASGIEISDLTVDANFPELKGYAREHGVKALNLEAIHLRSDQGGHWIHAVKVIHAAGELGDLSPKFETFPVWIVSVQPNVSPSENKGNIIENVTMTDFHGGLCTAIAVANAVGIVRNNVVDGYQIGYGGWSMGPVAFLNNTAINTEYGFNIDSLANDGVRIDSTRIIHPRKYGLVIGGGGTYSNFKITNNTIELDKTKAIGLVFQGNVTKAMLSGNKILADNSAGAHATAIVNRSAAKTWGPNHENTYQGNTITAALKSAFEGSSQKGQNCFHSNVDENGKPKNDLPDNRQGPCPGEIIK